MTAPESAQPATSWPDAESLRAWREQCEAEIRKLEAQPPHPWTWRLRVIGLAVLQIARLVVLPLFAASGLALFLIFLLVSVPWSAPDVIKVGVLVSMGTIAALFLLIMLVRGALFAFAPLWRWERRSFADDVRRASRSLLDAFRGREPAWFGMLDYERSRLASNPPDPRLARLKHATEALTAGCLMGAYFPEFASDVSPIESEVRRLSAELGIDPEDRIRVARQGRRGFPWHVDTSVDLA